MRCAWHGDRVGDTRISARLAGSLLGELLYERGEIAEAERLLDEGYKLGAEGGPVDFKLARYVVGARIKALRGDRAAAARRLTRARGSPRPCHFRDCAPPRRTNGSGWGCPSTRTRGMPPLEYSARRRPVDGIEEITAQLEEDTAIRLLLRGHPHARTELACTWAQEWVDTLEGRRAHGRCCRPGGCSSLAWPPRGASTKPRRCSRRSRHNAPSWA